MNLLPLSSAAEAEQNMRGVRRYLDQARQHEARREPRAAAQCGAIAADLLEQVVNYYQGDIHAQGTFRSGCNW